MPSKKRKKPTKFRNIPRVSHKFFWPLVSLIFIFWFIYRSLFNFPILFDESIGKAIFFGFPVWLYLTLSNFKQIAKTVDVKKLHRGILLGVAYGGIFGFVGTIAAYLSRNTSPQAAELFMASAFWWEFFLALLTAFWETLFFFSFVMLAIMDIYKKWPLSKQVLLTALIFALFHIPNTILRFDISIVIFQIMLLFIFSIGQAFLFAKEKNAYTLIISHAIWGMVLLIHWS